ncbi:hypothetical protein L3X38_017615 [Prunus dulcis]|uniref:Uncharacterized protein n=1 Tax=Prunus dulcis TaxID=3755 RepID=A0AAD4W977_PRUDU|nr:hypothetical protein L3X38_017615 [Prunus dulcis]
MPSVDRERVCHGFQGGIQASPFNWRAFGQHHIGVLRLTTIVFQGLRIQETQGSSPNIPREEICTNKVPPLEGHFGEQELALLSSPKFSFSRLHPSLVKSFGETIIPIGEP